MKKLMILIAILIPILLFSIGLLKEEGSNQVYKIQEVPITYKDIQSFDGSNYCMEINQNKTFFNEIDLLAPHDLFHLSKLDGLSRAGFAITVCSKDTIADEERSSLSAFKPTGYSTYQYQQQYVYNKCHLLMFAACGGTRTDCIENLVTGTKHFNTHMKQGMLSFESRLLDYIMNTNDEVLYRVTPIYKKHDLVCLGVLMEAKSLHTDDFEFNVFIYNEEPGLVINHANGEISEEISKEININDTTTITTNNTNPTYVLNTSRMVIHYPWCKSVSDMKEKNKEIVENKTKEELEAMGYHPCGNCQP